MMENGMDDITKLIDAITRQSPKIPVSVDLWSYDEIAAYLKRSRNTVKNQIVNEPGFPCAFRLPSGKGRSNPLWKAREIIDWVEKHREKKTA